MASIRFRPNLEPSPQCDCTREAGDAVFANVRSVTSVEYFYGMIRHKVRLRTQNQPPCGDARIGIKRALVHT